MKAHLTSVFRQIGVTDRTQAALWAQRHGVTRTSPRTDVRLRRYGGTGHDRLMTSLRSRYAVLLALVALWAALTLSVSAAAGVGDDRDEVRSTGTCTRSSETTLRLRTEEGTIRVELEIETSRRGSRWTVILLHERRIAFRGTLRARGGGSLKLRRTVPDWLGSDAVAARATGSGGETCRVSAVL